MSTYLNCIAVIFGNSSSQCGVSYVAPAASVSFFSSTSKTALHNSEHSTASGNISSNFSDEQSGHIRVAISSVYCSRSDQLCAFKHRARSTSVLFIHRKFMGLGDDLLKKFNLFARWSSLATLYLVLLYIASKFTRWYPEKIVWADYSGDAKGYKSHISHNINSEWMSRIWSFWNSIVKRL